MIKKKNLSFARFFGLLAVVALAGCAHLNMEKPIILDSDVAFAFGSAELTPAGASKIDQYAASLLSRGDIRLEIIGHSDRIGDARANQVLSERRAQAVRNQLLKHRFKPDHIVARGLGSRDPVVTNCNQTNNTALIACLAPNRRVEINVTDTRW